MISAGGAFVAADGSLRASNYSSGFASRVYPGRNVPDVSGLVGELPRAVYLMLPQEPGSDIERDLAGSGTYPNGDETAAADGWASFSGTSTAAPQVAGACALLREVVPALTPQQAREALTSTARDVVTGNSHRGTGGESAREGPDLATGAGLVDATAAVAAVGGSVGAPLTGVLSLLERSGSGRSITGASSLLLSGGSSGGSSGVSSNGG